MAGGRNIRTGAATDVGQATPTGPLILAAAMDLFAETGYEAASMRQIAARVGVKPASLYNHYASKEEILWEIVETSMLTLIARQEAMFQQWPEPLGRLTGFVRIQTAYHAEHSLSARIVNSQLSSLTPDHYRIIADLRRDYERRLRQTLEEGHDAGLFAINDLRITSYAILEIGMGVALWYRPEGPLDIDEICAIHEALVLRMIGATHPTEAGGSPSGPAS